jgi:hypothetical protein
MENINDTLNHAEKEETISNQVEEFINDRKLSIKTGG